MKKQELIDEIAKKAELSKADAKKALDATLDSIMTSVKKGNDVSLIGFGSFKRGKRPARKGRNPQTGETIKIAAAKTVKFSVGKGFKDLVSGKKK